MLRPPRTTGDEAEIEALIAAAAPSGYTLKYPKSGSHRSAIITVDLNGDDENEAIAFFREKNNVTGLHMLVMYKDGGKWKTSADFITETADVDCVEFANLDSDPTLEILTGYATYTTGVNFLSCYRFGDGETEAVDTGGFSYSAFYCGNLDSSGKSKVIALSLFTPEIEAKATMLEYSEEKHALFPKSSVPMDAGVVKYKNVLITDLTQNLKGVIVDGVNAGDESCTQIIYFNKQLSVLRNPLITKKGGNPTRRSSPVISADTDNDMIAEIPTVRTLASVAEKSDYTAADLITWNSFDDNTEELLPERSVAANYRYACTIKIPDDWELGSYTVLLNPEKNSMTFYKLNKGKLSDMLFEIKVFDVKEWDQGKYSGDNTLIYKDTRYAYTFLNFNPGGEMSLSDDAIKTAFSVLNEMAV